MIARRSASLMLGQAAISRKVRPQPMQRPLLPSTAQIFWQGEDMGVTSEPYRFSIKTPLTEIDPYRISIRTSCRSMHPSLNLAASIRGKHDFGGIIMRFASLATGIAALTLAPLALAAAGPQLSPREFVQAVQCVAYQDARGAELAAAKWRLNTEAARQPETAVAEARRAAAEIKHTQSAVMLDYPCTGSAAT
jgi:hypothetical protein